MSIADLRNEYTLGGLKESDMDNSPFVQFEKWFDEAVRAEVLEPNAMTLATVDKECKPTARVVLLKGIEKEVFVFYTNYESRKGKALTENPNAALVFLWHPLTRQVNITGHVEKVSHEESEAYFRTRPLGSQLGAWASGQSQVIESRAVLERRYEEYSRKYEGKEVPLPPYWGGFRLKPDTIEFWQGRPNRLHDRLQYIRNKYGIWEIYRLSP
ncbi:MAG: pyridoxamine 5'-phosphate oxidase [Chlorobiales bacterium]|nr:pyridoxamine 5'-phosphate oxidase [Chlorobiales bacterium]